jgi:hypothetical protein
MEDDPLDFHYESAGAKLAPRSDGLPGYNLYWVRAMTPGLGHGSGVMRKVLEFADENDATLYLVVNQFGPPRTGKNNKELREFYSHFGFEIDPDRPLRPAHMIRHPRRNYMPCNEKRAPR